MLAKEVKREKVQKSSAQNIKFKVFLNMFVRIAQYLYFDASSMKCLLTLISDYVDPFLKQLQEEASNKFGIQVYQKRIVNQDILDSYIGFCHFMQETQVDAKSVEYFKKVHKGHHLIFTSYFKGIKSILDIQKQFLSFQKDFNMIGYVTQKVFSYLLLYFKENRLKLNQF